MTELKQVIRLHTIITCDVCGKESDMDEGGCNIRKDGKDYCSQKCFHVDHPPRCHDVKPARCSAFHYMSDK